MRVVRALGQVNELVLFAFMLFCLSVVCSFLFIWVIAMAWGSDKSLAFKLYATVMGGCTAGALPLAALKGLYSCL